MTDSTTDTDRLAEADREYRERIEFMSRLGYGDDKTVPAARLADIVDAVEYAFSESRDHFDCPNWCEVCGERLAAKECEHCHGSGCGPLTGLGAYDECEHCAGSGRIHEGCAERSYADLVKERDEARVEAARLQERLDTTEGRLAETEQECDDLAIQRNHMKNRLEDLGVIVDDED